MLERKVALLSTVLSIWLLQGPALYCQPGTVDLSFDPGTSADGWISAVAVQADGKVLLAGSFETYQGVPRRGLVRTDSHGLIDTEYSVPFIGGDIRTIVLDGSGSCLVGGTMHVEGVGIRHLVRVNPDGSLDAAFDVNIGSGPNQVVSSIHIREFGSVGNILIGGGFTLVSGQPRTAIAELLPNGSLDGVQDFSDVFNTTVEPYQLPWIFKIAADGGGSVYACGRFTMSGEHEPRSLVKVYPDGTVAATHNIPVTFESSYGSVFDFILDGTEMIVVGLFTGINGASVNSVAVIESSGDVDLSFAIDTSLLQGVFQQIEGIIVHSGHYLIQGSFYNGVLNRGLVLLDGFGSVVSDFEVSRMDDWDNVGPPSGRAMFHEANGNIMVTGPFSQCGGVTRKRVTRIHGLNGPALWSCLGASVLILDSNDTLEFEDQGPWTEAWYELNVEGCMSLTISTCIEGASTGFGTGLLTSCPSYIASLVPFVGTTSNPCGGWDYVIEELDPGTYWFSMASFGGSSAFSISSTLCGPVDCLGVPGGADQPGSSCDDGNGATDSDTWNTSCDCVGIPVLNYDCVGVVDGSAQPGEPCDDGLFFTSSDTWTSECVCAGLDCAGEQGGNALPGTPCDDLDPNTLLDEWSVDCVCGTATGIKEGDRDAFSLQVRPNPCAADRFEITLSGEVNASVSVRVFDATMRLVHAEAGIRTGSIPVQVDRSRIPAGSYFLEVQVQQERVMHRLILQ